MPLDNSAYVGRYFALTLDGSQPAGFLKSWEGGEIKGELITQQKGGDAIRAKHVNNPVIGPVTVSVGLSMSDSFYAWVQKSWSGDVERRNGSIVTYDPNWVPKYEYQFTEALVLETTIPTLDGQSKEPGFMTIKFQAETASHKLESGERIKGLSPAIQTQWSPSNFRLEIDGLDVQRVSKIDSFTVKQNAKPMSCGPDWMYQLEPTSLEFPNLSVYMAMASAKPFFDWHDEFIIQGKNGPEFEKTGAITFLDPSLTKELLTIELKGLGITACNPEKADASSTDQVRRAKAELYCEEMVFKYK